MITQIVSQRRIRLEAERTDYTDYKRVNLRNHFQIGVIVFI